MAEIIKHKKEAPLAGLVGMGGGLTGFGLVGPGVTPPGQANYADGHSGSYTWVCPPGVTSVSIVCIGGGAGGKGQQGRGGGGGACAYKNNITVVPGTSYSLQVGAGGQNSLNGAASWFKVSGSAVVSADHGHGYGSQNDNAGGKTNDCIGDGAYKGGNGGFGSGGNGQAGDASGSSGNGNGSGGAGGTTSGEGGGGAASNNGLFIGVAGGGVGT